ncbi:MAG: hypothetical protein SFV52_14460 [Saprospiraceae bacterium]|nr:hypothetical protein [Saprospiraceae bacterium]
MLIPMVTSELALKIHTLPAEPTQATVVGVFAGINTMSDTSDTSQLVNEQLPLPPAVKSPQTSNDASRSVVTTTSQPVHALSVAAVFVAFFSVWSCSSETSFLQEKKLSASSPVKTSRLRMNRNRLGDFMIKKVNVKEKNPTAAALTAAFIWFRVCVHNRCNKNIGILQKVQKKKNELNTNLIQTKEKSNLQIVK